jgi:hypothetical protein
MIGKERANRLLEEFCLEEDIEFVRWAHLAYDETGEPSLEKLPDGVHLKPELYPAFADLLTPLLENALSTPSVFGD